MAKPKQNLKQERPTPVHKKTSQGKGRGSKPSHGRKKKRGQG
jgi:hypothetical protein